MSNEEQIEGRQWRTVNSGSLQYVDEKGGLRWVGRGARISVADEDVARYESFNSLTVEAEALPDNPGSELVDSFGETPEDASGPTEEQLRWMREANQAEIEDFLVEHPERHEDVLAAENANRGNKPRKYVEKAVEAAKIQLATAGEDPNDV